jgi:glutamine amidotransferase PdxT
VAVLAEHGGLPVVVQHGRHLASTFHPELSAGERLHRHFAGLCAAAERAA